MNRHCEYILEHKFTLLEAIGLFSWVGFQNRLIYSLKLIFATVLICPLCTLILAASKNSLIPKYRYLQETVHVLILLNYPSNMHLQYGRKLPLYPKFAILISFTDVVFCIFGASDSVRPVFHCILGKKVSTEHRSSRALFSPLLDYATSPMPRKSTNCPFLCRIPPINTGQHHSPHGRAPNKCTSPRKGSETGIIPRGHPSPAQPDNCPPAQSKIAMRKTALDEWKMYRGFGITSGDKRGRERGEGCVI